ncbi:hypothetical protein [Aquabacterium sp.]|uniref:hypothetical protein n=1 Tax=Aquabacterium sp. TaxID=1872578 RepID=UPI0025BA2FD6|nr:hypothetical protein [Aquabacterium sp.]
MNQTATGAVQRNSPATVLFASLIGTTVEFFHFYIYATAAALIFPKAFFARPVGSAVFGPFGDRIGRKATLSTFVLFYLMTVFGAGNALGVMGMTYGPLGTLLSEMFPTAVRYTGSSMTFNFAGILGASLAPYLATTLATKYGLAYVGYDLSIATAISLLALWLTKPGRDSDFDA